MNVERKLPLEIFVTLLREVGVDATAEAVQANPAETWERIPDTARERILAIAGIPDATPGDLHPHVEGEGNGAHVVFPTEDEDAAPTELPAPEAPEAPDGAALAEVDPDHAAQAPEDPDTTALADPDLAEPEPPEVAAHAEAPATPADAPDTPIPETAEDEGHAGLPAVIEPDAVHEDDEPLETPETADAQADADEEAPEGAPAPDAAAEEGLWVVPREHFEAQEAAEAEAGADADADMPAQEDVDDEHAGLPALAEDASDAHPDPAAADDADDEDAAEDPDDDEADDAKDGKESLFKRLFRKKGPDAAADELDADAQITEIPPIEDPDVVEVETYPVQAPYAFVRILYHQTNHEHLYELIEPKLSERERNILEFVEDTLVDVIDVGLSAVTQEEAANMLREHVDEIIYDYSILVSALAKEKLLYYILRDFLGFGKLDPIMRDEQIEDVSCDGPKIPIFLYHRKYESIKSVAKFESHEEADSYVIKMAQRSGKHISIAEPLLDATLPDGSRLNATLSDEVTANGSTFTIRKFKEEPFTAPDLVRFGTMNAEMLAYWWIAVQNGASAIYAGGTASGKTTSLNAILLFIPPQMKIVSIEDTREVNLPHENWIPGVTRSGFGPRDNHGRQAGEIDMFSLLKAALRQRPEYILVGEVRGQEAYALFQAMATGHTAYGTMHADSVESVIHRLESDPISIPRSLLEALDIVSVQIQTRVGEKRVRRTKQITEVVGLDPHTHEILTNEVFTWNPARDEFEFSGVSYVLERVQIERNLSEFEMRKEMRRRKEVIEWMIAKNIRDYISVGRVITSYYKDRDALLERVRREMGHTDEDEWASDDGGFSGDDFDGVGADEGFTEGGFDDAGLEDDPNPFEDPVPAGAPGTEPLPDDPMLAAGHRPAHAADDAAALPPPHHDLAPYDADAPDQEGGFDLPDDEADLPFGPEAPFEDAYADADLPPGDDAPPALPAGPDAADAADPAEAPDPARLPAPAEAAEDDRDASPALDTGDDDALALPAPSPTEAEASHDEDEGEDDADDEPTDEDDEPRGDAR